MVLPSYTENEEEHPCFRGVHRWAAVRHVLTSELEAIECKLCGYKIGSGDKQAVIEQIQRFYKQIEDLKTDADGLLTMASAFDDDPDAYEKLIAQCRDRIGDVQNLFVGIKLLNKISTKM